MKGVPMERLDAFIKAALHEDIQQGDHTSNACIPQDQRSKAKLLVKDIGMIAGVSFAEHLFHSIDDDVQFDIVHPDGDLVEDGDIAFYVECGTRSLLKAERVVLNTMQRMSGIATKSHRFAMEVENLPVKVLDTRKTAPLMRFLEKWAVRIGGCHNYRDGLYDWIMIKDNHIKACGGVSAAIEKVSEYQKQNNLSLGVTIEVRNLVELHEVLTTGNVTRIMLDNFELPLLKEAVLAVDGQFQTEASGGVRLQTLRKIAKTGVDYISVGALTHSAGCLDLSLKIIE